MEIRTEWILEQAKESRPPNNFITTDTIRQRLNIADNSADNDWLHLCYRVYSLYKEGLLDFSDDTKQLIPLYDGRGEQFLYVNVIKGARLILSPKGEAFLLQITGPAKKYRNANAQVERRSPTQTQKDEMLDRQDYRCKICGKRFGSGVHPQFDHIIPLHKKGSNSIDNYQALCPSCHDDKSRKERVGDIVTDPSTRSLATARLKLKNFARVAGGGFAEQSWSKTFQTLDDRYSKMKRDEIIDQVFSTTIPNELKDRLQAVVGMYKNTLTDPKINAEFVDVCKAFGLEFDGINVHLH